MNLLIKKTAAFSAAVLLAACAEGQIDADGTLVEVMSQAAPSDTATPRAAGTKSFRRASGERVDLEAGWVGVQVIGLGRCSSVASLGADLLDGVLATLVSSAHAHRAHHGEAPGGTVDVVQVADGVLRDFSVVAPAPGSYCSAELRLIRVASDEPPRASARVAPCYYPDSAGVPDPMSSATPHECWVQSVPHESANFSRDLDQPVTVTAESPLARLAVSVDYSIWFDGLDMVHLQAGDPVALELLQRQIMDSIRVSVTP